MIKHGGVLVTQLVAALLMVSGQQESLPPVHWRTDHPHRCRTKQDARAALNDTFILDRSTQESLVPQRVPRRVLRLVPRMVPRTALHLVHGLVNQMVNQMVICLVLCLVLLWGHQIALEVLLVCCSARICM